LTSQHPVVLDSTWEKIADVLSGNSMEQATADANLIASAPDLLKACKACMEVWKDEDKTLTAYEMRLLQSAIGKAEGLR
jgi:hypothetical protein